MKWGFLPKDYQGPRYLCCNADESEPGTFKDRIVLEGVGIDGAHVYPGTCRAGAALFALAIALIGTRMGMTVERDTRAVGTATTSTVVQSIVAVILLDAHMPGMDGCELARRLRRATLPLTTIRRCRRRDRSCSDGRLINLRSICSQSGSG